MDYYKLEINKEFGKYENSKLVICILIAQISREGAYKQVCNTFEDYLNMNDLPFPASTACEYASIGNTFLDNKEKLQKYGFVPGKNLYKLLALGKANHKDIPEEELFTNLVKMTGKEFKKWVNKTKEKFIDEQKNYNANSTEEKQIDSLSETKSNKPNLPTIKYLNLFRNEEGSLFYNEKSVGHFKLPNYPDLENEIIPFIYDKIKQYIKEAA